MPSVIARILISEGGRRLRIKRDLTMLVRLLALKMRVMRQGMKVM